MARKTGSRKASPKSSASKTKSKPAQKPKTASGSRSSPRSKSSSPKPSKSESSRPTLKAIALSVTGKTLTKRSSEPVIYGIQETKGKRTTVRKLDMAPQPFKAADLQALDATLKRSADAQGKAIPNLAFFQVKVPGEYERTKTGRVKRVKLKAGPNKGKLAPVYKTEIKFDLPPEDSEWRQLLFEGGKFSKAIHKNLQKRNRYEIVKSEMLGREGFAKFDDAHSRFVAGFATKDVTLKGRTLTEALRHIQVPVDSKWLKKNKVVLDQFRDNQIGNIFVRGTVNVRAKGQTYNIPLEISARYLTDLPNEIGRAIRQRLADRGATYTSPRELALIEQGAWKKLKALRGGLKTERARREIARLTQPGISPKSPRLKTALEKVARGKMDPADFPLQETDQVKVNLRFSFYRDPLAKAPKQKGKRKK